MNFSEKLLNEYGPPKPRPVAFHPLLAQLESKACAESVKDYEKELLAYFQELQEYDCPNPKTIDNQPELEWYMRPYLLNFLIDLHLVLRLSEPVLFLAVHIMDRYCSKRVVFQKHFQLVTTTSLWIAAKLEDKKSRTPTLNQLTSACSNVYDSYMFVQMESHILTTLHWKVRTCFTTFDAIQLCFKESDTIWPTKDVSLLQIVSIFFAELSCFDKHFMAFSSSVKAVSAIVLASVLLGDKCFQKHVSELLLEFLELRIDNDIFIGELKDTQGLPSGNSFSIISAELLRIDENTIVDIRRCCLLFLNDIFKPLTANKALPRALISKYDSTCLQDLINTFTAQNIDTYLHLCRLTQALLNPTQDTKQILDQINMITDILVGLELQQETLFCHPSVPYLYHNVLLPTSDEINDEIRNDNEIGESDYSSSYCDRVTTTSSIVTRSPWTPASLFSARRSLSNASSIDHSLYTEEASRSKEALPTKAPTPLRNWISPDFND